MNMNFLHTLMAFAKRYKLFSLAVLITLVSLSFELAGSARIPDILLSIAALLIAMPLLKGMWQDFRGGSYGLDILAITAIVASILLREYWTAMVIVLMLTGGEALEDFAEHRARNELDTLLARAPRQAHVQRGRKTIDIPTSEVHVGDKLLIKPGEVVPVDSIILEGRASFDESSITGESVPGQKGPGMQLLSGTINLDAAISARAIRVEADSQYQQIIRLVEAARNSQSPFIRLADRYAVPFTLFAFALAGGVWALSGDPERFLEVIVVATPCPLILAAPIAIISGMSRSAKHGIIVRTGTALEKLAEVKTFAFDKTGTLTSGNPQISQITCYGNYSEKEVLGYAAALESASNHILAAAICTEAAERRISIPKVRAVSEEPGYGLSAIAGGKRVLIGRIGLLQKHSVKLPKNFISTEARQTLTYVAVQGELAGALLFEDAVRSDSRATINRLKKLGIRNILMITGDNRMTATVVGKQVGITTIHADALPGEKLRTIETIKKRPVAFVGDGVNDAPVLTAADVGIALGARGSTAASESADIVIMLDDLGRVASSVEFAKRTLKIAKQSVLLGIGLSVGLMLVFATGRFEPIHGALVQELVDVAVIFNALRAHHAGRR